MSGTIASYLDLLRNFDTQQMMDDNVIDRFKEAGRRVVFYGDDTWLKLFPERFTRHEGTTSFFVSDTVEVDANVTRNVVVELQRSDWDVMVLHYLGLDHIGHSQGPMSPLMPGKQREMDGVIATIVRAMSAGDRYAAQRSARLRIAPPPPSLIVLVSDHGMSDVGGHGGTSNAESSTVALFIAASAAALRDEGAIPSHWPRRHPRIEPTRVSQVDIAPTLSLLFGLPIPRSSIGVILHDLFLASPLSHSSLHASTASAAAAAVAASNATARSAAAGGRGSSSSSSHSSSSTPNAPFNHDVSTQSLHHLLRAYQINAEQYLNGNHTHTHTHTHTIIVVRRFDNCSIDSRCVLRGVCSIAVLRHDKHLWDRSTNRPSGQRVAKLLHTLDDAHATHRRWLLTDPNDGTSVAFIVFRLQVISIDVWQIALAIWLSVKRRR
jgi:hypothetical protein